MDTKQELDTLIRARYPIIWLETFEETRAVRIVNTIAIQHNKTLLVWSATAGLCRVDNRQVAEGLEDPLAVLDYVKEEADSEAIIILKDFHRFLDDVMVYRKLRDLHVDLKATHKTIIILSPIVKIPTELQKVITVVSLPLPDKEELEDVMLQMLSTLERAADDDETIKGILQNITETLRKSREEILSAGLGLTEDEYENVLAKSVVAKHDLDVQVIISEKEQIIKKSGVLEYYHSTANMKDIGGLEVLKKWIAQRKLAFSEKAREFGLRTPRGVFLAGPPGTGKSLTAKVIAATMEMPLLRLDVSRIYSSLVGSSEQNISQALKTAEATAPSLLWVDEVEKAMAGVQSSGTLDSGVTARVFGTFLTWLQEHTKPVFVVVTSNNPLAIPPEFMRAGRFDEIFLVDLPAEKEREEIFAIHIAKVKRNPDNFNIKKFAKLTNGFSGAEIEAVVQDALYQAFYDGSELTDKHIIEAIKKTIPLSKKRKEDIEALRKWGQINAINASAVQEKAEAVERRIEI